MDDCKIYETKLGYKIGFGIVLVIVLIGTLFLMSLPFILAMKVLWAILFICSFGLMGFIFFLYGLIELFYGKLYVYEDRFFDKTILGNREICFDDIKGAWIKDNGELQIESLSGKKPIKISIGYMERGHEIFELFNRLKIKDLRQVKAQEEVKDIETDNPSIPGDQALEKVKKIKRVTVILNIFATGVSFWAMLFPRPYDLAIIINCIFPLIGLIFLFVFKTYVRFDGNTKQIRPVVAVMIMLPALSLALRSLLDIKILYIHSIWLPIGILFVILNLYIIFVTKEFKKRFYYYLFFVLPFIFILSYGYIIQINALFDKSQPATYKTMVIEKKITKTKRTYYDLIVKPWGPKTEDNEISVSKRLYNSVEEQGYVTIKVKKGNFGINWFYITH